MAAAGLIALPILANAQAHDGAFINGSLGSSTLDRRPIDDSDTSYGVNFGYRWVVSPRAVIGFEVGYVDLGRYSAPATVTLFPIAPFGAPPFEPEIYAGSVSTEMSGWILGVNSHFNLSPNWYVGGRAGFLRASVDSRLRTTGQEDSIEVFNYDVNADGWYAGASFGYDFNPNWSVGLNYDYYSAKESGSKIDPDVVSVTGEYRF